MNFEDKRLALRQRLLHLQDNQKDFESLCFDLFAIQKEENLVYKQYLTALQKHTLKPKRIEDIPCLPIQFFKSHEIKTGQWKTNHTFLSSGTTGIQSKHFVRDLELYLATVTQIFESHYGPLDAYCFIGLLPSYLEREGSSLITMVAHFIDQSPYEESGFYLYDIEKLLNTLRSLASKNTKVILFGVSYALLDVAEKINQSLQNVTVIETGGMKGRRKEMIKDEMHKVLSNAFDISGIDSEYGMTELFSQAYAKGGLQFSVPNTMFLWPNELNDPFVKTKHGKTGQANIVDLANLDSCCFIKTDDLIRVNDDQTFEIMGRMDHSDMRGCNLLVEEV